MLLRLPKELLSIVLQYLEFEDLDTLLALDALAPIVRHHLHRHYRFHYQTASLLRLFESLTPTERHKENTHVEIASQILNFICLHVQTLPKGEHRSKFSELLDVLHQLVLRRILDNAMRPGLELDYASLCLVIRSTYLHSPSMRALHDPKYRRRSTKYPLAPFLPRDYTWIWRDHCARVASLPHDRSRRLRFAQFFGALFEVTSLYLESNVDGTFDECVREGLVSGNVESLLVLCNAADRPVDVDAMCMMVTHAGEQLRSYLDTMADESAIHPHDIDPATITSATLTEPPEWLIPDRYKVHPDAKLRLKLMDQLCKRGWDWFH